MTIGGQVMIVSRPTSTDDSSYYRQSRNDEDYSHNSRYNNYSHADIMSHIDDKITAKRNPKLMIYEETDSPLIYASHKTNANLSDYWR